MIILSLVITLVVRVIFKNRGKNIRDIIVFEQKFENVFWTVVVLVASSNIVGRSTLVKHHTVSQTARIGNGLIYHREMWHKSRVHSVEVDLTKAKPVMLSAKHLSYGKRRLSELVVDHNNASDRNSVVAMAVNGDFFDDGGNQGFAKSENLQTAPNPERASVEFRRNGTRSTVQVYRLGMQACIWVGDDKYPIRSTFNNRYRVGDIGVYTCARVVSAVGSCGHLVMVKVKLTKVKDGQFTGVITQVVENPTTNLQANAGEIVLVAGNEESVPVSLGAYAFAKRNFHKDVFVGVSLPVFPKPGEIAISGGPELMRMGQYFVAEGGNNRLCASSTARTAIGITKDHHHLLVVSVEGSPKWATYGPREIFGLVKSFQGKATVKAIIVNEKLCLRAMCQRVILPFLGWGVVSHGMTMQDLYQYMVEHDSWGHPIYEALNLDGGGSSTMVVGLPPKVVNYLMEGQQAQIANALGFAPR